LHGAAPDLYELEALLQVDGLVAVVDYLVEVFDLAVILVERLFILGVCEVEDAHEVVHKQLVHQRDVLHRGSGHTADHILTRVMMSRKGKGCTVIKHPEGHQVVFKARILHVPNHQLSGVGLE
jgi:hypothetical protein